MAMKARSSRWLRSPDARASLEARSPRAFTAAAAAVFSVLVAMPHISRSLGLHSAFTYGCNAGEVQRQAIGISSRHPPQAKLVRQQRLCAPHRRRTSEAPRSAGLRALPLSMMSSVALVAFVLVDASNALVVDWAEKRPWQKSRTGRQYSRQTVLLSVSMTSVLTGLLVNLKLGGMPAVRQALDLKLWLQFLPSASFEGLGLSLKLMAYKYFQAGTVKVFGQLRLPFTAFVSYLFLARSYSWTQCGALAILTTSCVGFFQLKDQTRRREGKASKKLGLAELFGWVLLSVGGRVLAEFTYKSSDLPYYVQKVAQDAGHLLTAMVMLFVIIPRYAPKEDIMNKETRPDGFFDSWDYRCVVVGAFLFVDAWLSNFLLKSVSGVAVAVAKAVSVIFVYFVSTFYSKDRRKNPTLTLMAINVILASMMFATGR
eukprot:TRINITY_DN113165_c0_g1_i1.p1 TRINITY_DN113165_c0_g1~~TRINITY_DN113165_c0_g1_i1.p1  ORF type:complete len:428 (-),score=79.35 TRINITY_DN113165_c0_g1_i1:35-1318(-)